MTDIFISYTREDRHLAEPLASALSSSGWSVWWDYELVAGQRYDEIIGQLLDEARVIIVLWSKQSVDSRYVNDEALVGLQSDKLIPVLVDDITVPFRFRALHTIDLVSWDGQPGKLKTLLSDLTRFLEEPQTATKREPQQTTRQSHTLTNEGQQRGNSKTIRRLTMTLGAVALILVVIVGVWRAVGPQERQRVADIKHQQPLAADAVKERNAAAEPPDTTIETVDATNEQGSGSNLSDANKSKVEITPSDQESEFIVSAASTDFSQPTLLPSRHLHGFGTREYATYYFEFDAGPGPVEIEATAHNAGTGSAVNVVVTDLDNSIEFAGIRFGATRSPKTLRTAFVYGRKSRMLLRLETDDSTEEYRVRLSGAVGLPAEDADNDIPTVPDPDDEYLVSNASTDPRTPTALPSKHLHGYGIRENVTYYFLLLAGPGEISIAATAYNDSTGSALALKVTDLDNSERFAKIDFGATYSQKTLRDSFVTGRQMPLLLQLTLDESSVEFRVRLTGAIALSGDQ